MLGCTGLYLAVLDMNNIADRAEGADKADRADRTDMADVAKMGNLAYMVYVLKVYILEVYVVGGVELYILCEGVYYCRSLLSVLSALSSPDGSLPDRQRQKDLLVLYSICFWLFSSVIYSIYIYTYILSSYICLYRFIPTRWIETNRLHKNLVNFPHKSHELNVTQKHFLPFILLK